MNIDKKITVTIDNADGEIHALRAACNLAMKYLREARNRPHAQATGWVDEYEPHEVKNVNEFCMRVLDRTQ